MLAEGIYFAQLKSGITTTAKTAGTEQVVITFDLTHVSRNGEWTELEAPTERRMYLSLSGAAVPYTETKLEMLHFNGDYGENMAFGKTAVELRLYHEQYQGQLRERLELADWTGGQLEPVDADTVRRLNARWKATHAKPVAPPPGQPRPNPSSAPADKDLPF